MADAPDQPRASTPGPAAVSGRVSAAGGTVLHVGPLSGAVTSALLRSPTLPTFSSPGYAAGRAA